jgi:hypothetical protein
MPRYPLAALLAATLLSSPVFAQSSSAPPSSTPAANAAPQGANEEQEGPPEIEAFHRPLLAVTSVEVTRAGALTSVHVDGIASSDGWGDAVLVPLVHGIPSDGVLDLIMVAEPPSDAMPANGFKHLDATLLIEENHPYKAVRVRSATNVATLHSLSGKAEAKVEMSDCHDCIGHPVATTGLPKGTRILSPTDPFEDVQPNPNRLTLLVGEDGKVIEAMWQ